MRTKCIILSRARWHVVFPAPLAAPAFFPMLSQAAPSCESLAALPLTHATITHVEMISPGAFPPPPGGRGQNAGAVYKKLPAFCRIAAALRPTADSDIKIEIWMPAAGW